MKGVWIMERIFSGVKNLWLIKVIESAHMKSLGKRDGRIGLPIENDEGQLTSPLIAKETERYDEGRSLRWKRCEELVAPLYSELNKTKCKIKSLEDQYDVMLRLAETQDFGDIPSWLKSSRQKQILTPILSGLNEENLKLIEIQSQIDRHENIKNLENQKEYCRMSARLASYWDGCVNATKDKRKLPDFRQLPIPQFADEIYLQGHSRVNWQSSEL
jgi:hypothetical protein